MTRKDNINQYIAQAIKDNWDNLALTDFDGSSFQFRDVARKIAKLHILFECIGIKPGDRIALCGRNSAQWSIAFLASVTYGAVAVPILHDFKADISTISSITVSQNFFLLTYIHGKISIQMQ